MKEKRYESNNKENIHFNKENEVKNGGKITVYTLKDSINGEKMKGIKVNIYRINGVSPQLEMSKYSDENGKVEFFNIENGNYRIIEIIDKRKYEKPTYVKWNEINISNYCREEVIYVINKEKKKYVN